LLAALEGTEIANESIRSDLVNTDDIGVGVIATNKEKELNS
jgi:hypothetical protein